MKKRWRNDVQKHINPWQNNDKTTVSAQAETVVLLSCVLLSCFWVYCVYCVLLSCFVPIVIGTKQEYKKETWSLNFYACFFCTAPGTNSSIRNLCRPINAGLLWVIRKFTIVKSCDDGVWRFQASFQSIKKTSAIFPHHPKSDTACSLWRFWIHSRPEQLNSRC